MISIFKWFRKKKKVTINRYDIILAEEIDKIIGKGFTPDFAHKVVLKEIK